MIVETPIKWRLLKYIRLKNLRAKTEFQKASKGEKALLIKSIDIMGFKSFADKTTLKFGRGLTAVVGPNGSGKSNVSDAIRWVLGEQSTKNLRGSSMEDVIFSGTSTRKPHGYCEVTINFDNSDRSLNFNDDNVSVTRRYYRSHESEYSINGASVRLKDVHELFMDTGLGRDGYSMIGQGKIDTIVSSKSNERRDIFEEASGISRYRYRKTDAERKLGQAEENLVRLRDILEELKSRVGPLKQQSEKAEKFLVLADKKRELEIGLWLDTLEASREKFRKQEGKITVASQQYDDVVNDLEAIDKTIDENTLKFASLTVEIDTVRGDISSLEEKITRAEGEINVVRANIEHNNENIERLNSEKINIEASHRSASKDIEEKNALIAELENKRQQLSLKTEEISEKLSGLIKSSESISRKLEDRAMELNRISMQISQNRVDMVTAESSVSEILVRIENIKDTINQKNTNTEKLEKEMNLLKSDKNKLDEKITSAENSIKGYEMRFNSRKETADKIKNAVDKITADIDEKRRRAAILEDLQNNMEGYQQSVKSCMAEAKKGLLKGIHGPVSDIISVPGKYAVAIEIALGAAAQNIVVDSDADAKMAINYLKSHNKGRATFLPISTIRRGNFNETGLDNCVGYVGMADSLVKCGSEYENIIKWILGRTVIAEDLDSAVAISKKFGSRFKIVSLDGQVVNAGGSLTGGSLNKNIGLLSRKGTIDALKKEAEKLCGELEIKKEEYDKAVSALSGVEADILAVRAEASTANEDKIRVDAEIKRVSQLIASEKAASALLKKEEEEASARISELKQSANNAKEIIEKLESDKKSVETEMADMNGGRDETAEERESLSAELTDLKLAAAAVDKDIEAQKSVIEILKSDFAGRDTRTAEIENEIALAEQNGNNLKTRISDLESDIENIKNEISDKKQEAKSKLAERDSVEASSSKLRQDEKGKTLERERINGELERLKARKDSMTKELDDIVRKLYDEYELTKTEAEEVAVRIENPVEAQKELSVIKADIRALGNVNVAAIEEYKEVDERYRFLSDQVNDVEKTKSELIRLISDLTDQMKQIFSEGFLRISENFSKIFTEMFGGGHAELKLSDPNDPLQSGIDIIARLPGKNVPSLEGLSGGEKALIAISIYFAIMHVNAPPFCFLDEVETALDDINVERFANYMKHSDLETQFICITHRRGTMEAADMLYGVTMQERGVTKLIELNVAQLEMDLKSLENQ